MSIDVAFIRAMSVGKSTLTNAMFVEQYSDMNEGICNMSYSLFIKIKSGYINERKFLKFFI